MCDFDQNPRTHADANFRIRASLMLCSSWPSATRCQTDAISLLSTPCADPTPLRLIVSNVISPLPAAVVCLAGGCVLFSESTSIRYRSRAVGLAFKLDSNPYAIQQLGV